MLRLGTTVVLALFTTSAFAAPMDGAWETDVRNCAETAPTTGQSLTFDGDTLFFVNNETEGGSCSLGPAPQQSTLVTFDASCQWEEGPAEAQTLVFSNNGDQLSSETDWFVDRGTVFYRCDAVPLDIGMN
jgi:hypothetical protein